MSSENLLRGTSCVGANSGSHSSANSFDGSSCSSDAESDDYSLSSPSKSYASNSTPQTVYHMVQTAQGLVAQPIQLSSSQSAIGTSAPTSQKAAINSNANKTNNSNNKSNHINSRADSSNDEEFSDDLGSNHSGNKKKQQKRGVLPKQATSIMRSWLFQHIVVSLSTVCPQFVAILMNCWTASVPDRGREASDRFANESHFTSSKQLVHKRQTKNSSANVGYGKLSQRKPRPPKSEHIQELSQKLFGQKA